MSLERDASTVLGATISESVTLLPLGFTKDVRRSTVGGLAGLLVSSGIGRNNGVPDEQLAHEGYALLVQSSVGVVMFAVAQGALRQKLGAPIWRIAPGDIVEVHTGKVSPGITALSIRTRTGALYAFELPKLKLKGFRSILASVGAQVADAA